MIYKNIGINLPRFLSMKRIDTFPMADKFFIYKDNITGRITKCAALHRASCSGICRGRERYYILMENENTGQLYLEETIINRVTSETDFALIEDTNEWKHILAYITWHLLGATEISEDLKTKLDRKIRNLAGISQEEIERLTITNPDFMTLRPFPQPPTQADEEQEEKLKKRD
jgi:hypothetical protein